MQPQVAAAQQPNNVEIPLHQKKASEVQWKGRVFSLNFIDALDGKMKKIAAIMIIAGIALGLAGYVGVGLVLGVIGVCGFIKKREFDPNAGKAYRYLAVNGRFGSHDNLTYVNFENKNNLVTIHLTQKELNKASKDAEVFVGEYTISEGDCKGVKDWLFSARVDGLKKQITVIPETLQASRLNYSVTVDNAPIQVNQEVIPCYVNDRDDKFDNYVFDYDFSRLHVKDNG